MSELIEKLARAIHEADPDAGSWDEWVAYADAHPHHQQAVEFVRRQARAVLACLADNVSPEMVQAGRQAWLETASDYKRLDESIANTLTAALRKAGE